MKKLGKYKGYTIIQHGRTCTRFSARLGSVSMNGYKAHPLYETLGELHADIDRRERRIQLIMADPRL